jgi:hypothetical protein
MFRAMAKAPAVKLKKKAVGQETAPSVSAAAPTSALSDPPMPPTVVLAPSGAVGVAGAVSHQWLRQAMFHAGRPGQRMGQEKIRKSEGISH